MGKFEEDGIFWLPTEPVILVGCEYTPFNGLDVEYCTSLEQAYGRYCSSIKAVECTCGAHGVDLDSLDYSILVESRKSLHKLQSIPRIGHGNKLRLDTSYQSIVKAAHSHATKEFTALVTVFERKLSSLLSEYVRNNISMQQFRSQSSKLFADIYTSGWNAGRKASGLLWIQGRPQKPTIEEERWFRAAVREELTFWNSFLDELEEDKELEGKRFSPQERLRMYVETVWFMYQSGRMSGMPSNVLLFWWPTRKRSGQMCPGCKYMVEHSPFPRDLMPTVPRAGNTPCLMRCVHKVIIRYSTVKEVEKRAAQLPGKSQMVRELANFMHRKAKKPRGREKHYNPWAGRSSWGQIK